MKRFFASGQKQTLACSFCGKDVNAVPLLLTGSTGNICSECVVVAALVCQQNKISAFSSWRYDTSVPQGPQASEIPKK